MLTNFISRCKGSDATKTFGVYIENEYSHRTTCWAACYRPHSYINTNMYLESMHKTLKYCVFEKKSIRRMDRAIYFLTSLFEQINAKFERMLVKPSGTRRSAQIFKLHGQSVSGANDFLINKSSENEFIVKQISKDESVTVVLNHPGKHPCHLLCKICKFCVHTFKCSCFLNRYKGEFCVHLHLISTVPICCQISSFQKILL